MALRKELQEQIEVQERDQYGTVKTDQGTLAKITRWIHLGMNEKNIATNLGIHPVTFSKAKKAHPCIQNAIDKGRSAGEEEATSRLFDMIRDPKSKGHASAVFFVLKHKHGWSDTALAFKEGSSAPSGVKFELLKVAPADTDTLTPDTDNVEN